jgi:Reverse transcriptase (RNA-dependent DNA polymerase)
MIVLSIILGLATMQVDYSAAFVHAPIDRDPNWSKMTPEEQERSGVYIQMPRGFSEPGKVLKLNKSLYGLKQAPRNFFLHLKAQLESVGFRSQEDIDPCLFIWDKVICLVYIDNTLFHSPKIEYIHEVIEKIRARKMDLEVEGEVAGFLAVHIERDVINNTVTLLQEGLMKRIIEALNTGDLSAKKTPATAEPLVKDEFRELPDCIFSYSSVVGMMQYLQNHSQPDITYVVSQCARFVHNPRQSHEQTLIQIGQYLKGTIDKGLIFKPSSMLRIDCYVDADFAGLWPHEDKEDPICVKSRSGYVILIARLFGVASSSMRLLCQR